MSNLGKLERIDDLRTIWKHEAQNFSRWLAEEENLKLLSAAVGVNIVLPERESSVGKFSVDIFAKDGNDESRTIVIENQLNETNHGHLGKIITYAAGKSASVIIWIVESVQDEHKKAVEWLNENTDKKISFFLIEIEIWRIGESPPAPRFNIIEKPTWVGTNKKAPPASARKKSARPSDIKTLQKQFWESFNEYAFSKDEFKRQFEKREARAKRHHFLHGVRAGYYITMKVYTKENKISIALVIRNNKELFRKLQSKSDDIEQFIGLKLQWKEEVQKCRIIIEHLGDIKKPVEEWPSLFDWFCERALKFKEVVKKFDT